MVNSVEILSQLADAAKGLRIPRYSSRVRVLVAKFREAATREGCKDWQVEPVIEDLLSARRRPRRNDQRIGKGSDDTSRMSSPRNP